MLASIFAFSKQASSGFHDGGFTEKGNEYAVAGVVHKGEFVANKNLTDNHEDTFSLMHSNANPHDIVNQLAYEYGISGENTDNGLLRAIADNTRKTSQKTYDSNGRLKIVVNGNYTKRYVN